jgi:hypothetical protein
LVELVKLVELVEMGQPPTNSTNLTNLTNLQKSSRKPTWGAMLPTTLREQGASGFWVSISFLLLFFPGTGAWPGSGKKVQGHFLKSACTEFETD